MTNVRPEEGQAGEAAARTPPAAVGERDLGRVVTVPNALSIARLGLLAGFVVLVLGDHAYALAAGLLAVAGITDFLDGYVARRFDQVTTLGKVLDPTVDRLVLATAVVVIVVAGAVPLWLASLVLAREGVVAISAVVLALAGARRIDVTVLGKAGTFGLMCCFPLFLWGDASGALAAAVRTVAWVGLAPALACSLAATAGYVPRARRALLEGRGARAAGLG